MAALNGWYALFYPFTILFLAFFYYFAVVWSVWGCLNDPTLAAEVDGPLMDLKWHQSTRVGDAGCPVKHFFMTRTSSRVQHVMWLQFFRPLHVVQCSHFSDQRLTAQCPQEFLSTSTVGMLLSGFFYCWAPVLYQNLSIFISQTWGCVVICHQLCWVRSDSPTSVTPLLHPRFKWNIFNV